MKFKDKFIQTTDTIIDKFVLGAGHFIKISGAAKAAVSIWQIPNWGVESSLVGGALGVVLFWGGCALVKYHKEEKARDAAAAAAKKAKELQDDLRRNTMGKNRWSGK